MGAEVVVMTVGSEARYFGLRGGAVRMWQLIQEGTHSIDEIVAAMQAEFDAGESVLRQDVEATVSGLEARGLVRFS
jgi:hypothetical protein